jgi:hypothetical protein
MHAPGSEFGAVPWPFPAGIAHWRPSAKDVGLTEVESRNSDDGITAGDRCSRPWQGRGQDVSAN